MNVRIGFKLPVAATPGFNSLHDYCFRTMWQFSAAPEDPEDETVMEMNGTEELYPAVNSAMHAMGTDDHDSPQDAAHRLIQIAKALHSQEVVRIYTCEWETTCSDTEGECTSC